ncbi:MAG: GNAT family N-acetyltransferase [Flavobacterium sp.]|nr:GNAT family N-acetyltransferase [Flavobacterium sp.]
MLKNFAFDNKLWEFGLNKLSNVDELEIYISNALTNVEKKNAIVWVIQKDKEIVGTTRLANIDYNGKTAQLGWTWINPKYQGTKSNKISKYLILQYAFEKLNLNKIELKTDTLNTISNKAILSIGAKLEATLENDIKTWRGNYRDTNVYTIEKNDWQNIKLQLLNKIER